MIIQLNNNNNIIYIYNCIEGDDVTNVSKVIWNCTAKKNIIFIILLLFLLIYFMDWVKNIPNVVTLTPDDNNVIIFYMWYMSDVYKLWNYVIL